MVKFVILCLQYENGPGMFQKKISDIKKPGILIYFF